MLHSSLFEKLAQAFNLGKLLEEPMMIAKNRIFLVITTQGKFVIKRFVNVRENSLEDPEQGMRIAQAMAQNNIPAICALSSESSSSYLWGKDKFMIYPWVEGQVLSSSAASIEHAAVLGACVGRMHALNLQLPGVKAASWQNFAETNWGCLINNMPDLREDLAEIQFWNRLYRQACQNLNSKRLISHGDLIQANVIWHTKSVPYFIDWESAGWVHPEIEALGIALNWAGVVDETIDEKVFYAFIESYQKTLNSRLQITKTLYHAGLGSWLAWLGYNLQQSQYSSENAQEAQKTISVIRFLLKNAHFFIEKNKIQKT